MKADRKGKEGKHTQTQGHEQRNTQQCEIDSE